VNTPDGWCIGKRGA